MTFQLDIKDDEGFKREVLEVPGTCQGERAQFNMPHFPAAERLAYGGATMLPGLAACSWVHAQEHAPSCMLLRTTWHTTRRAQHDLCRCIAHSWHPQIGLAHSMPGPCSRGAVPRLVRPVQSHPVHVPEDLL